MDIKKEILWRLKSYPYGTEFNQSMAEAIEVCARMFDRAKKSIKIISGSLNREFYDSDPVIASLEKKAQVGIPIEIIYGPGVTRNGRRIFTLKDKGVQFYRLPQTPQRHLMSVDDKDVRIEVTHKPASEVTRAAIYHGARPLANVVGKNFEELRERAARV